MVNFLVYLYQILSWIFWAYSLLIVIDSLLSWVPTVQNSVVGTWVNQVVEPYLNLFRVNIVRRLGNATGIDVSPVLAIIVLYLLQDALRVLFQWLIFH